MGCVCSTIMEERAQHVTYKPSASATYEKGKHNGKKKDDVHDQHLLVFDNNVLYTMTHFHKQEITQNKCYNDTMSNFKPVFLIHKFPHMKAAVADGDVYNSTEFDFEQYKLYGTEGLTLIHFMNMDQVKRITITTSNNVVLMDKHFDGHKDEFVVDFGLFDSHNGYMIKTDDVLQISFLPTFQMKRDTIRIKVDGSAWVRCRFIVLNHLLKGALVNNSCVFKVKGRKFMLRNGVVHNLKN